MVLLEIGALLIANTINVIQNIDYWFPVQTIKSFIEACTFLQCTYYLIGAVVYGVTCYYCSYPRQPNILLRMSGQDTKKRIMFVIAHPDDEVMFFGPTILNLIQNHHNVYLLCLSSGNYLNLATRRKMELIQCCKVLGIPSSNVTLMQTSYTPDDPICWWNIQKVAQCICDAMENLDINTVYTFDMDGVSGHINHRSIFFACAYLCLKRRYPAPCTVYVLDTILITRKYSFFLDAAASFILNRHHFMVTIRDSMKLRAAFREHRSQVVWYRKLYTYFSRYMYINTYTKLEREDLHLMLMSENIPVAYALNQNAFEDIFD